MLTALKIARKGVLIKTEPLDYLTSRGLSQTTPEALNDALRTVLDSMEPAAFRNPTTDLAAEEQAVLQEGVKPAHVAGRGV